jgi:hypothetical protein
VEYSYWQRSSKRSGRSSFGGRCRPPRWPAIQQLPGLLWAAAQGLQGANITVLDGAEGLNSVVASFAAQGMALLDAVGKGMGTVPATEPGTSVMVQHETE